MLKCQDDGCPFACTEYSEQIQNYGCLPTPLQIINMRVNYDKTWACHSDNTKPCVGALNRLKELGYENKPIYPLVTESDNWGYFISDDFRLEVMRKYNDSLRNKL